MGSILEKLLFFLVDTSRLGKYSEGEYDLIVVYRVNGLCKLIHSLIQVRMRLMHLLSVFNKASPRAVGCPYSNINMIKVLHIR